MSSTHELRALEEILCRLSQGWRDAAVPVADQVALGMEPVEGETAGQFLLRFWPSRRFAFAARCCCYNGHGSSSGRCHAGPVFDLSRGHRDAALCPDCRDHCTLGAKDDRVMWAEAREAAELAGWSLLPSVSYGADHFVRGAEHFEVTRDQSANGVLVVVSTRYAPRDLLDGRLAALDSPENGS